MAERETSPGGKGDNRATRSFLEKELLRFYKESGISERLQGKLQDWLHDILGPMPLTPPVTPQELSPYEILGVKSTDPTPLIRKVYHAKVMFLHPDKGGNAEEFKTIQTAYTAIMKERHASPR